MKRQVVIAAIVFGVMMALAWPVLGAGGGHGDTGSGQGGGHGMHQAGAESGHKGMEIHNAAVDGFQLRYELIDMAERMKGMANMPRMKHSHHLMVYVRDNDGKPVENATAGYLIEGPDGSEQKAMCMGMGAGGYGADVNFKEKGSYTVKTKVVSGDKKVMDSFEYEVK